MNYWGNPDPRPRVIGVGYLPGVHADAALSVATELALHENAALRLIAVVDGAGFGGFGVRGGFGYAEIIGDVREETRERLDAALRALPPETRAQGVLREGDPSLELIEQTQTLDLLVTGSRGYGSLGRAILGGVTSRVVSEAACRCSWCPAPPPRPRRQRPPTRRPPHSRVPVVVLRTKHRTRR